MSSNETSKPLEQVNSLKPPTSNFKVAEAEELLLSLIRSFHPVSHFDVFHPLLENIMSQLGERFQLKNLIFCRYNPILSSVRQFSVWPPKDQKDTRPSTLEKFLALLEAQKQSRLIRVYFDDWLIEELSEFLPNPHLIIPITLRQGTGGFLIYEFFTADPFITEKSQLLRPFSDFLTYKITLIEEEMLLNNATDQYHNLLESNLTAMMLVDHRRNVVLHANRQFTKLTQYPVHESDTFLKKNFGFSNVDGQRPSFNLECGDRILTMTSKDNRSLTLLTRVVLLQNTTYALISFVDLSPKLALEQQLKKNLTQLEDIFDHLLDAITHLTDYVDPYTSIHQLRTSDLACQIAEALGLKPEQIKCLKTASRVHDIGKILLPSEIINKPGKYSDIETAMVKTHAIYGSELISQIDFNGPVAEIVLQHHERLDGSGYPSQLKDKDLLLESKILAVANLADNLYSYRPARPAYDLEAVIRLLSQDAEKGRLFKPAVEACIKLLRSGALTSLPTSF